ncbi:pollen-specific leucine-rich repeat extensin-like protein 1 isoform X1 [Silurus meridionalis]|uniref:pollen-specific leucine-rich repeat extensin-like protein 1 isoform X1 n=1 Tax=Silurus meridionalis TaxID=175797 RepID=UPI001EEB18FB|nr:pollen-specific leucine-rich repeat extensin-like protein 1 isoform X1 [Silurus meridionalis]
MMEAAAPRESPAPEPEAPKESPAPEPEAPKESPAPDPEARKKTINLPESASEVKKMRKRAERFGMIVSPVYKKFLEEEKLKKRKKRFGTVTSAASVGADDLEAKRRKRAEWSRNVTEFLFLFSFTFYFLYFLFLLLILTI